MGYFGNWNKDQRVFQKAFTYNGCTKNNMQHSAIFIPQTVG